MPSTTAPTYAAGIVWTNANIISAAAAISPDQMTNGLRRPTRSDHQPPTSAVTTVTRP